MNRVAEQVFFSVFLQFISHLEDATEKLFLHTIYSALILTDVLYFVLIYTKKGLFQWPSIEEGEFLLYIMLKLTTKNRVSASPVIPHEKIYKRYSDEIVWKCANTV